MNWSEYKKDVEVNFFYVLKSSEFQNLRLILCAEYKIQARFQKLQQEQLKT